MMMSIHSLNEQMNYARVFKLKRKCMKKQNKIKIVCLMKMNLSLSLSRLIRRNADVIYFMKIKFHFSQAKLKMTHTEKKLYKKLL